MYECKGFGARSMRRIASALFASVLLVTCGLLAAGTPAYAVGAAASDASLADAFEVDAGTLDDSYVVDSGELGIDSFETGELPSGIPVDQDITYSHAESAVSNGVALTVYWDEPQLGKETHFHIVCSGSSSGAKVRMDAPYYYGVGEAYASGRSVVDTIHSEYQSYSTLTDGEIDYSFTMTASGTYQFTFYLLDSSKGIDDPLCVQFSISIADEVYPSEDSDPEPTEWTFDDADSSVKHSDDINWLASAGVSTGWLESDGSRTFRPYQDVARADMAAFLYRLAGSPEYMEPATSPFKDVDSSTPHYKEICWLASTGISEGWKVSGGSEFRPYAAVARCDMAAFLYRLAASPSYVSSGTPFIDCSKNTPHYKEICWLASTGVSAGWDVADGKEFRPYGNVARADMAAFLRRMHDNGLVGDFTDALRI